MRRGGAPGLLKGRPKLGGGARKIPDAVGHDQSGAAVAHRQRVHRCERQLQPAVPLPRPSGGGIEHRA
jgi:hypothetical protein